MTDFLTDKLTSLLRTGELDEYDVEILRYGINTVLLNLPKTILLVFICKKLGLFKPLMLLFAFYGSIRTYSRGIHAKTPLGCFITGTLNFLTMAYLSKVIAIPQKIYNVIFAYCFCVFLKYSPSGTEINPVYSDQIKPLKIKSVSIVVLYYFIGLKKGLMRNIVALSLLSQSIFIIPLTYKIAHQKGGFIHEDDE